MMSGEIYLQVLNFLCFFGGAVKDTEFSMDLLKQALKSLEVSVNKQPRDEFVADSIIQRFEYTYELSWKTLKRYFIENQNTEEFHVKNLWREAAKQGLIKNPEIWFEFHKARNATSHTYNKKVAATVIAQAEKFSSELPDLIQKLESLK